MKNNTLLLVCLASIFAVVTVGLAFFVFFTGNEDVPAKNDIPHNTSQEITPVPQKPDVISPEVPEKPKQDRITFFAAGDNIIHDMVRNDAKNKAADGSEGFKFLHMYENVLPLIQDADLAFVNQEAPIAGKGMGGYTGYPNFNAPEKAVYDLVDAGFDVFNIANNHMLDKGTAGYKNTVDFFSSLDEITYIGGYKNKTDYDNIRIIERNGISVALLSYTYSTNGYKTDGSMFVPYNDTSEIDRQSKMAREMADFVVVSMHWGEENSFDVTNSQRTQMQTLVNNNVDVIIGTHPHVLQPAEWQTRPDGKKTLVMYSIGNLLSNMEQMKHHVGAVASFDLVKNENGTSIENVSLVPTLCHFETDGGVNRDYKIYKLSEYSEQLLRKHARQNTGTDSVRDMQYLYNIVRENIPSEFLTEDFYTDY